MKYQHLGDEEREELEHGLWEGDSLRTIGKRLGRSHTTLGRELTRNQTPVTARYSPRLARLRALEKRQERGRKERLKNSRVRSYVTKQLKDGWSPEQIAGAISEIGETVSHEAIYQYVYAQVHRNGYGLLKPGREDLRPYLARGHKRRAKKGGRKGQRILKPKGPSIEERPEVVERRSRLGDWEGDSIEGRDHTPGLNSLVDRRSGLLLLSKLPDRTSAATTSVVARRLKGVRARTITLDNGKENQYWQELQLLTGASVFFAHPQRNRLQPRLRRGCGRRGVCFEHEAAEAAGVEDSVRSLEWCTSGLNLPGQTLT